MTGGTDVRLREYAPEFERGDTVRWYTSPMYGRGSVIGRTHIVRTSTRFGIPIETTETYCGARTQGAIRWAPEQLCAKCWKYAPGAVQERIPIELRPTPPSQDNWT
jgi:hypothetical protein